MPKSGQERTGNPGGGNNGRHYLSPDSGSCLEKSPSLQRIHQQSSTETSGLGASEFSSRESIHSNQSFNDRKCDHGHLGLYKHAMVVPTEPKSIISKSNPVRKKEISPDTEMKTMFSDEQNFDDLFRQTSNSSRQTSNPSRQTSNPSRQTSNPSRQTSNPSKQSRSQNVVPNETQRTRHNNERVQNGVRNVIQEDKELSNTKQSQKEVVKRKHKPQKLHVDDTTYEWKRKGSRNSIKSQSSRGSIRSRTGSMRSRSGSMRSRSGSNKFLGNDFDSAWMKWGKARRASYQRKLEIPDAAPVERATTPIKKARQELIAQFVHPDLTDKYISEDDINYIRRHRQRQHQMYHAIENSKKNQRFLSAHHDIFLSAREWKILSSFWKHKIFRRSRYLALFFVILSIIILCVSVLSKEWIIYNTPENVDIYEGMWKSCVENRTITYSHFTECTSNTRDFNTGMWDSCYQPSYNSTSCPDKRPHWQNAVIGLMIFAAGIGFLAAVLAILGVCTSPLPKKIYYFHSAGEIFLVSAMATGAALVIYPAGIEMDKSIGSHYYGSGYGLGWGSAFFFLCAALCMSLDDLVRESAKAKCCRLCFRKGQADGVESHQV